MDTDAPRHSAFRAVGIDRISYSVPDAFFPLQDATAPSATTDSSQDSTQQWSNHFQGPRARTQLRAWSRVQLPSQLIRNFSGTIMKRVGFPIPRATKTPTIPIPVAPANIEVPAIAEDGMPTRRVVRRLHSYEASDEEWRMKGKPLSRLEMTALQMQAKADVIHSLNTYPTSTTRAQVRQRRAGHYVQTVPVKRRAGMVVPCAGNRLGTYAEAMQLAKTKSQFRVPSRRFSVLPRPQTTSPTLSPIALFTPDREPVTPAAVMEPPRCMSDAKSPTKRSPRHKSPPIKNDGPRISEPAIKLLPATTPKIEPSPIKPASPPPATPLGESRSLHNRAATPSTFPKAAPFGTAFAGMQRPSAIRPGAMPWNLSPTKLATTPCPTYRRIELPSEPSPVKRKSSASETPSRSVAGEPMTPRIFNNISFITADVPSPIASISALFPASPAKQSVELQSGTPQKPADFDFGTMSPAFNSVTWLNDAETTPRPVASLKKKGSRRQSEPLIRGCLKAQSRRKTISPQKLVFRADETLTGPDGLSHTRRQPFSPLKFMLQADQTFTDAEGLFSPVKKDARPTMAPLEVKSVSPVLPRPQKSRRSFGGRRSGGPRQAANEVVNIDMRQNPDIFGTKAVSLSVSPVLGAALPTIAESGSKGAGPEEPATLQLFSPSVEIGSRRDVEQTDCVRAPAEQAVAQEAAISPVANNSIGGLGIFESLPVVDLPLISIEEHSADAEAEPNVIAQSPSPAASARSSSSPKEQKLSSSPTLNLSFTPVNSRSPNSVEASVQQQESIPESPPTVRIEIVETVTAQSHDYDSPGRDYMREFIRRSRPKRPSTTEAGSPVCGTVKRQPLGPKSPNTESPSKNKRKLEKEHDQRESPLKRSPNASPKKIRRYAKTPTKKDMVANEIGEQTETLDVKMAIDSAVNDEEEDDADMDSASRRSSRLRNQTHLPAAKSAIPTSIKMRRNGGPTLNSAVRSAQQELTHQTRANTQKNKGGAEYPAQFLAKQLEQAQTEQEAVERESSSEKEGRKCVNWRNPLAMYQEETQNKEQDKPKKAKSSKSKTVQMSGIAKPVTRAKTTADKERTARLAEHFGMVSNGTPAKPQRSTRSRMRI